MFLSSCRRNGETAEGSQESLLFSEGVGDQFRPALACAAQVALPIGVDRGCEKPGKAAFSLAGCMKKMAVHYV